MMLSTRLFGHGYTFKGVKDVLAKANEARSGDRLAGIAAQDARERVAAKQVLSELLLSDLRNNPAVPYEEDCVTRLIQDNVNEAQFTGASRTWSVGELREYILGDTATPEELEVLRKGLTSEMVAAVAKICSNGDLIYGAKLLPVVTKANTTLGLPGRFSSRLQPNDTRDDIRSITAQIYEGLSYGSGDAVIGVNPVTDNVESVTRILHQVYEVIEKYQIPTQGCVLAHISTQMEAVRKGAPIGLLFQSICGSEKGLKEFGISSGNAGRGGRCGAALLACGRWQLPVFRDRPGLGAVGQRAPWRRSGDDGGAQLRAGAALLALHRQHRGRFYRPGIPLQQPRDSARRAGGPLHGQALGHFAMGCDCCYTNHADADQNSNESLLMLMATAGCNFVIAMPLGDDIMLNYQTCSFHDIATVRQTLGLRPAPEFERWLEARGLMANGRLARAAGDPSLFF
jgi:ethanolamine ammonia-lyase large subunit